MTADAGNPTCKALDLKEISPLEKFALERWNQVRCLELNNP
jgi:hypothetical protein